MEVSKIIKIFKEHKSLVIIALLILVEVLWFISSKDSYAYYSGSNEIPILSTKIGNFAKDSGGEGLPNKVAGADLSVQFYLQDYSNSKKYNLTANIPAYGYHLNKDMSNCTPSKEQLTYSDYDIIDGKVKFKVQDLTTQKQIICHIYYDKDANADIAVYVLIQDEEYGVEEHGGKHYRFVDGTADLSSYTYLEAKCNESSAKITGYKDGKFIFTASKPSICYAYFDKES